MNCHLSLRDSELWLALFSAARPFGSTDSPAFASSGISPDTFVVIGVAAWLLTAAPPIPLRRCGKCLLPVARQRTVRPSARPSITFGCLGSTCRCATPSPGLPSSLHRTTSLVRNSVGGRRLCCRLTDTSSAPMSCFGFNDATAPLVAVRLRALTRLLASADTKVQAGADARGGAPVKYIRHAHSPWPIRFSESAVPIGSTRRRCP